MNLVFKKSQMLKLNELVDTSSVNSMNNSKPALAVSNSEEDGDTSALRTDVEKTNQYNSGNNPIQIDTQSYTNKKIPVGNDNVSQNMTFKNTPQAASQIQQFINTTPASSLPKKIRLQNGVERNGNLVEVATFKKNELDKFLKSL